QLPDALRPIVENAYGVATGDLFLISAPFAVVALIVVLFIKEKPLKTTSGMERRLAEAEAEAGAESGAGVEFAKDGPGDEGTGGAPVADKEPAGR
ncbi:hypothetical protein ADL27_39555, partial [Streptomyces sp. NRRL F-6602]